MASPLILQPDAAAGKDAMLLSQVPIENYGTNAALAVGDDHPTVSLAYRSLIAFDLSAIPAGSTITSAMLSLWEVGAGSSGGGPASWAVELRRILMNWVEAQATWNIYSTGNNWGTAGCGNATDRVAGVSASRTLDGTAAADFVNWSGAGMVADVQAWRDGTENNYGWLLSAPTIELLGTTPTAYNYFNSSDYTADPATRPKLVIEYYTGAFALRADHYSRMRRG